MLLLLILDNTLQRNSLSYDVLFTMIAYDLIKLEVIHNLSIILAPYVRECGCTAKHAKIYI